MENGSSPQRNDLRSEQKLLDLLGSEIERADAKASKSGVTRWTLIASMGGLLWLLSHQLESSRFIWAEVGTAFLALIVLSTLYTGIRSVLLSSSLQRFPIQTGRVLIVNSLLGASRLDMAFRAVRDLILVLVSVMLVLVYNRYGVMALTFVYGLACLVNILTIILSYVPWPIPLTNTKKYWLNAKIIVLGLMIVTSIGGVSLALPIISPESRISMTALRIGGLLFVLTMLLDWIVRHEGSDRWPIDTLVAIRHAYHSGQLDLANAWDQCDIVFTGTTVSRVFQADLECILRLQREMADKFNQIDQEYERVEKMFVASPGSPPCRNKQQCEDCRAVLTSVVSSLSSTKIPSSDLSNRITQFCRQVRLFRCMAPDASSGIEDLHRRLATSQQAVSERLNAICQKISVVEAAMRQCEENEHRQMPGDS